MLELSIKQKLYLKGLAHGLQPVVIVGNNGLTPAVIKEIEINLTAHELIKVRALGDDRQTREKLIEQICTETDASFVQHIGKLIVLYRSSKKAKILLPKE